MRYQLTIPLIGSLVAAALSLPASAQQLCIDPPIPRQGEVSINQSMCMTDHHLYLMFNVPYDKSDVTISTTGGTYEGSADAGLIVYTGTNWNADEILTQVDSEDTNEETLSLVLDAGMRYLKVTGNIAQTKLLIDVSGGELPPPIGDYVDYDYQVEVSLPDAAISAKSQYHASVNTILATSFSDYDDLIENQADAIEHVSDALHFLAQQGDATDADLLELLNYLIAYEDHAEPMTLVEAEKLSIAIQAVATMPGFLATSEPAGKLQEAFTGAVANFYTDDASEYFANVLPHIMALVQYHSSLDNPFSHTDYIDATIYSVRALGAAGHYGNNKVRKALNERMTEVLSVMRAFTYLGNTSWDQRQTTDDDRSWLVSTALKSLARIHNVAAPDARSRINELIGEVYGKLSSVISHEVIKAKINFDFLLAANRQCDSQDPLGNICLSEAMILPKVHQCGTQYLIRTQLEVTDQQLTTACNEVLTQEQDFYDFFNTNAQAVVADDYNDDLEIIIFSSPDEYERYADAIFDIGSGGGGIYLEGNPAREDNQAQFIAMVCDDNWVGNSCEYEGQVYNLKHELIHYLDGRINQYGRYKYHDYIYAWTEGLAEYLAQGDDYQRTKRNVAGKVIPPLYNIMFMSGDYDNLYQWSYYAIHYLAKQHPQEITLLANALRQTDTAVYPQVLAEMVARVDDGFVDHVLSLSDALAPATEVIPNANELGHCNLAQQYVSPVDYDTLSVTVTNTTDYPVSLFWIDNTTGEYVGSKNYKTLLNGESYQSEFWRTNDRMMLAGSNYQCLGVAVMSQSVNEFTITPEVVADQVVEAIPEQNQFGQCDLMLPHIKDTSGTGAFSVTNTTDYPVSIVRIDDATGKPLYSSNYGILQQGESYQSSIWYANRRFMVADARLNCLAIGVLDHDEADYAIDEVTIAEAAPEEQLPAANTIGSCDLIEKHYIDDVGYPMSITNNSDTPVRIYRVLNETGVVNFDKVYATLAPGEDYTRDAATAWYGKRRAVIANENDECLGVAIFSEPQDLNAFTVEQALVDGGATPIDSDNDGVSDQHDAFPHDPSEWADSDLDGVGDNSDAFPNDATETIDSDLDGVGDNSDAFPQDASEWLDSDGDGLGDNSDPYPNDKDNGLAYCDIEGGKQTHEWITAVGVDGQMQASSNESGGYRDFADVEFSLAAGNSHTVTLQTNNDSDAEYWYLWIDYNQDGDFDDANELVIEQRTSAAQYTTAITPPQNVAGYTRMRVALSYRRLGSACGDFDYGEAEDYRVNIAPFDGVDDTPFEIPNACAVSGAEVVDGGRITANEAICLDSDNRKSFSIANVSDYQSISIATAHGSGELALLFRQGGWPSESLYDAKSDSSGTTQQCIDINTNDEYWGYLELLGTNDSATLLVTFDEVACH